MNKPIKVLSGLLIFQLALTVTWISDNSTPVVDESLQTLVTTDENKLKQIKIIDSHSELVLNRATNGWYLEDFPDIPLSADKLAAVTKELANTKVTWPVTKTQTSHQRFNVAESSFEKQIEYVDTNGQKQVLYIGDSPSFKQLYVRNADQDEVYKIEYSVYQLSTDINSWVDKSLLSVDGVSQITHTAVHLEKGEQEWRLSPPSVVDETKPLDLELINQIVNQLAKLSVTGITKDKVEVTDKLTVKNEQDQEYEFSFAQKDDRYFVTRNDFNYWFTLPKFQFDKLANLTLDKLIDKPMKIENTEDHALSD